MAPRWGPINQLTRASNVAHGAREDNVNLRSWILVWCTGVALTGCAVNASPANVGDESSLFEPGKSDSLGTGNAGVCEVDVIADYEVNTTAIGVDDMHVYWARSVGGSFGKILRRAKGGGTVETVADELSENVDAIALDATHVYWAGEQGVARRALSLAGGVEWLAGPAGGIALDDSYIYWTDVGDNAVRRRRKTLTPVETVDDAWGTSATPRAIAVDASHVYWTSHLGAVARREKTLASPTELIATSEMGAGAIAIDDSHVYWKSWDGLYRRHKSFASGKEIVAPRDNADRSSIVVGGDFVYWTRSSGGGTALGDAVLRRDKTLTSRHQVLATNQRVANGIAIDAGHLYWTAQSVQRVPRGACGL
jgi:hypothetical protein